MWQICSPRKELGNLFEGQFFVVLSSDIYIYMYICICIFVYIYIYTYLHMHTHTHIYIHIYVYMYMYIYIYTYTYTHTHIYIYILCIYAERERERYIFFTYPWLSPGNLWWHHDFYDSRPQVLKPRGVLELWTCAWVACREAGTAGSRWRRVGVGINRE